MDNLNTPHYKCVIVDDDQLSIDILENFLHQIPGFDVTATYNDPARAITQMKSVAGIDFLFLDIRMDISGLDVAKILRDQVRFLFFVTSYEEYAIDAFGVHGDMFLVKPISFSKLSASIEEVLRKENRQKGLSMV